MARNLGLVMRRLFGTGTASSLQAAGGLADDLYFAWLNVLHALRCRTAATNGFCQNQTASTAANQTFVLAA